MASYPLLYGAAASLLPKLDPIYLNKISVEISNYMENDKRKSLHPYGMEKDVMEWKEILSNLPSFIETHEFSKEAFIAISKFVDVFKHLLNHNLIPVWDWENLVGHMTEYKDHYYSKTKEPIILQSSLSSSLHKSKQPIEESSSGVYLDDELDTRTSLLSSLTRALSSLKAPDVKPLDDLPQHLLPCLAYCALYPQGSTFVPEILINQWLAEDFLLRDRFEEPLWEQVGKGNLYFNKLLEKGVFVEPIFRSSNSSGAYKWIHSCKMHPDIHSAVCGMASNEVLIIPDTKQGSAAAVTTKYIALHKEDNNNNAEIHYDEFPLQPTTCLYFIPEINKGKVTLQRLFSKFDNLLVFHFAGTQFEKLPSELTALKYLRHLGLSGNALLKSLHYKDFPPKLRTLAVDGCVNLEEVDAAGRVEFLQLSHCPELKLLLLTSYSVLRQLHILECPRLELLPKENIGYHIKELVCHNCDSLDLDLGECRGNSNYVEVVGLPKLIELKLGDSRSGSLLIANCSNLKSIDNHLQKSIDSLETLRIYDCPNLEISSKVLSSMIKLRSIDIKNCPTIMTTTFSNEAIEDLAPWIMNKDREFIFDGHRHSSQEVGLFGEIDNSALGPLLPASSAQTSSYVLSDSSCFKFDLESSKTTEDSKGSLDSCAIQVLTLISEIRRCPKWPLEQHKLYCSHLFPNDFEFERDELVQLWTASGLHPLPSEYFGYKCFDRLFNEGFIIKTSTDILAGIDKYKIKSRHFGRDSKDHYALLDDDNGLNGVDTSKCRHVSLVGQKINEETFKTLEGISELRTVLLIRDYGDSLKQIPSSFFEALTCMRALDLSGSHIRVLPSSIKNMRQLVFLDLSFTLLERIPESITRLGELQTLKLKGCKHLHTLPKGMKQLRSLRHLDFDVLSQLKGMGQLTLLRTLRAFIVSEEDGCSIRELENLNKLGGSFCISGLEYASEEDVKKTNMQQKKLTRLHLKWNDYDAPKKAFNVLLHLGPDYASLEELKISNYPGSTLTTWVKHERLINVVRLELISCKIESFKAPEELPNLKYLNITDMNGVQNIECLYQMPWLHRKKCFPKLETLIIDGMRNLESWTCIEEGDFPHLTKLRLMYCPKFTQPHFLSILHSLTYLEISHCESFTSLSSKPLPPSLETLIINKCPALKENYAPGKEGWKNIQHVPNIWIDMKGLGSANQDTGMFDGQDYEVKLFCCVFPGDFEFERDTLIQSWMSMGLFKEPLEWSGDRCFEDLLGENFIIYSRTDMLTEIKKYKINVDKVRTFPARVGNKDLYVRLGDDENSAAVDTSSLSKCRHVSLVGQNISRETFKKLEGISELRSVLLIRDYGDSLKQIPSSFFKALTCMRALDLSGSHVIELPSSIGDMTQLGFLDLSFTLLERIPESIARLQELQTLKLKGCKHLHTLPNAMKRLRSLRYLDFDVLRQLTSMPKKMGLLTKLKTLSAFIVSQEDGCSLRELRYLNSLCGSFCISGLEHASGDDAEKAAIVKKKYLTKLHLKWNDFKAYDDSARNKASSTLKSLQPNASLEHLQISYYPGSEWPEWIQALTNLVSVTLLRCKNKEVIGLGSLPKLKYLTFTDINKVTDITFEPDHDGIRFPMLETLTIDGMLKLRSWTGLGERDCPCLREISVKHCPKLKAPNFLSSFRSLTFLEISHCKSWEKLAGASLQSLDTLMISNSPLLKERSSGEKGEDWEWIKDVPNIWIDMKGFGKENRHTDSDDSNSDSDYSEEETNDSDDSD